MYHDVVEAGAQDASGFAGADAALYKLERESFERHLDAIAEAASQAPSTVFDLKREASGRKPLFLTFDDGGVSAHERAADILERRGWRGHFFVTTGRIGTEGFLSRGQIRDLDARGHVVGSHSATHPLMMARCSPERIFNEWRESVEILSEIISRPVVAASVPGGFYSRRVAEAASRAGIEYLFTSEPTMRTNRVEACTTLGRYTVQRSMSPQTVAEIARGGLAPRLSQMVLWNAKKVTKIVGGEFYLRVRKALIR